MDPQIRDQISFSLALRIGCHRTLRRAQSAKLQLPVAEILQSAKDVFRLNDSA
jgi:hypothetical protein